MQILEGKQKENTQRDVLILMWYKVQWSGRYRKYDSLLFTTRSITTTPNMN